MLRKILYLAGLSFLLVMAGVLTLLFFGLSSEPKVPYSENFNSGAYERAEALTKHLSSALSQDQLNRLVITGPDVKDLVLYSANKVRVGNKKLISVAGLKSLFSENEVEIQVSVRTLLSKKMFLNLGVLIKERDQKPEVSAVYFGDIRVPGVVFTGLYNYLLSPLFPIEKQTLISTITGSVKGFTISQRRMTLIYRTDRELRKKLKAGASALMLGSPKEKEILGLYLNVLSAAVSQQQGTNVSLSPVLRVMVGLAKSRSDNGGSAVRENERMLRALALQVADHNTRILLAPGIKAEPLQRKLLLRQRSDLTQHFLVSAALALVLDETTALEVGVSKEKSDAKAGGTGFSFPDLLADLAGIRFAVTATESEERARVFQDYLLENKGEHVFMPDIHWLPQGLSTSAYQDLIRHPLYPAMLDKMVDRLNVLPLYN